MSSQSARFVGSIPDHYDRCLGPRIFDGYAEDIASRVASLSPSNVLELAAGTGIVTRKLRDAVEDGCEIVATDLNEPMLDIARGRFRENERVQFAPQDAMNLSIEDASFDVIVCQFGVMFFPDKVASYKEAMRVLRPGGSYVLNVWGSQAENPFASIAQGVAEDVFPDGPPGFYKVPFHYHDAGQIESDLLEAGFREISIKDVALMASVGSVEEFANGLVYGNPLAEEIELLGGDPNDARDAFATALGAGLSDPMPLLARVIHAVKT